MTYHGNLATHKILIPGTLAYNLSPTNASFSALPGYAAVALEGADAGVFAQAQFANDVAALPTGHWQWNAWLTPKGRVLAVFALLKLAQDRLLLILPDHPADAFVEQLQRFVFRRKVVIRRCDEPVTGALASPLRAAGNTIAHDGEGIEIDFGSTAHPRTLRLAAAADPVEDTGAWAANDLHFGLPRLSEAQRGQWTPQQLSLDRLPAYSVRKGCYPGQEIVARTHFFGKAKRALALLEADAAIAEGASVGTQDNTAIGEIVCVRPEDGRWLALAVVSADMEEGPLQAGGASVRRIPLREGLQR